MNSSRLNILQVSRADIAGGAERSAHNLFEQYYDQGHASWLALGHQKKNMARMSLLPNTRRRNWIYRATEQVIEQLDQRTFKVPGLGRAVRALRCASEPGRWLRGTRGVEDFDFPGTQDLLQLPPWKPDIVHCHNLHGGYFDLRYLPQISAQQPTILNARDMWLATGHCAYGLGCQRWQTGCGQCPDLDIYPAIAHDATAQNWLRKRDIYAQCRLYVTAPSQWLLDQINESMLHPAIIDGRVIPNGVDTSIFKPADRAQVRSRLGIEHDAHVVMFAGNNVRNNRWKDYATMHEAITIMGKQWRAKPLLVLAIGQSGKDETIGNLRLRHVPFIDDPIQLAKYYQASDLYLHAAHVESFGNVLLEAKACGVPVVSTAVGGIGEHVQSLICDWTTRSVTGVTRDKAHGVLTEPGNPRTLAAAALMLLGDTTLRDYLSAAAFADARSNGSLAMQAQRFIAWYRDILAAWPDEHPSSIK